MVKRKMLGTLGVEDEEESSLPCVNKKRMESEVMVMSKSSAEIPGSGKVGDTMAMGSGARKGEKESYVSWK